MRFVELLRTTVTLSGAAATTLAVITIAAASTTADDRLVSIMAGWWLAATLIGLVIGRSTTVTRPIARLLAEAKAATMMPPHRPAAVVLNRLWPLLACTLLAGASAILAPQIAGIAAGFPIIWALAWRHQHRAVVAVEERDGVTFYVESTSPLRPVHLLRMPGFRREVPTADGTTSS